MTDMQKQMIADLRRRGYTFKRIGEELHISMDTVKSFCRRNNLTATQNESDSKPAKCKECGAALIQIPKQKTRLFCSKQCRENWWHKHPEMLDKKAIYHFTCSGCGKEFTAYGNNHRKYCSHECYIRTRFRSGIQP